MTLRRIRQVEPKPISLNTAILASHMWKQGHDPEAIEKALGVPPNRLGEAVQQGLKAMRTHPLMDRSPVTHNDPPKPALF